MTVLPVIQRFLTEAQSFGAKNPIEEICVSRETYDRLQWEMAQMSLVPDVSRPSKDITIMGVRITPKSEPTYDHFRVAHGVVITADEAKKVEAKLGMSWEEIAARM